MKAFAINRPLNGTIWEVDGTENVFGDLVVAAWLGQPNAIVPNGWWDITWPGALHRAQDRISMEIQILRQEEYKLQQLQIGPPKRITHDPPTDI